MTRLKTVSTPHMKGRGFFLILGWIVAGLVLVSVALWLGYVKNYASIGFGDSWIPKTSPDGKSVTTYEFQRGRTLWDWMQLLVVPTLLFVVGLWFNRVLKEREATAALDTQREAALQKYFDAVGDLITKGTQSASPTSATPDQELSSERGVQSSAGQALKHDKSEAASQVILAPWTVSLIRARTLTILSMLDGRRKGALMRFLLETELVKQIRPDRPYEGILSLENADLRNADLRGLSLSKLMLSHVDLRGADLRLVNLEGAYIDNSTSIDDKWLLVWKIANNRFTRKHWNEVVDLKGADLAEAYLNGANLCNIDLSAANLKGASLAQAKLEKAIINKRTRIDPKWSLVWKIVNEKAENIHLIGSDLSDAYLAAVVLKDKSLLEANLERTNLSFASLRESNFEKVTATSTDFEGARMDKARFAGARLLNADFTNAELSAADLSETWCFLAKFVGANLAKANLRRSDLESADLSNADLSEADLTEASLSGTNLEGALLTGAIVSDEQLAKARGNWRK